MAQDNNAPQDHIFLMRSLMDEQLETSDKQRIGRVGDVEAEWRADGQLVLTHILTGPQVLAGRVHPRLRPIMRFFCRDRFDHRIEISEIENCGPTIKLRRQAANYPVGQSEKWLTDHILRWIPGNGR